MIDWKLGDKLQHPKDGGHQHGWKGELVDLYPEKPTGWFILWGNGEVEQFLISDADKMERRGK